MTNTGSGITKAGWGGLAVPLNSDNADNSCSVNKRIPRGIDLERPIWTYTPPVGVNFYDYPALGNTPNNQSALGRTLPYYTSFNNLRCIKYGEENFIIIGGDMITSEVFFTLNVPQIPDNGTLIPTTSAWRQIIADHEVIHAKGYQSLYEEYYNNLSKSFCSKSLCEDGIELAQSELKNHTIPIETYTQCIHKDHLNQHMIGRTPAGYLFYLSKTYPVTSINSPLEFARCEAKPEPHQ